MTIIKEIGVPRVTPLYTPDIILTVSLSFLLVETLSLEGRLLDMSSKKSSSDNSIPAGTPSSTAPMAAPWDSPQVVTVNILPIDEPLINVPFLIYVFSLQ